MKKSLIPRRRSTRIRLGAATAAALAVAFVVPTASFADLSGGCDFAPTGTTPSCATPLSGSTFAGGDGNLLTSPTNFGTTDWQSVASLNHGVDLASGSTDNSFGQGTKEDNPAVTVVTGSIPPNKSDLTRFYEASQVGSNGHNFLYLAWERSNVLGTANMDFEINQKTQPDLTTTGAKSLNRTAGDLLVTYDFSNGGGRPTLGLLTWLTAAAGNTASQCFSSNALPCWGKQQTLNGTNSIGAVNNLDAVSDPLFPNEGNYLSSVPALQFGEAAIDLTAAGVFPTGTCEAFGSAFVKSRSSTSFSAEVKDFIAPIGVNISNCGTIKIRKVTENGDATFGYTTTGGLTPSTFNLSNGGLQTYGPDTVQPGGYSVTESTVPSGWTLKSLVCTATGTGTSYTTNGATVNITLAAEGLVDCTYTNHTNLSPKISTSLSESSGNVGDTVHDSATLTGATANAGGTVTYSFYTDSACTLGKQGAGTVTVTNGVVPDSNGIQFNSAGTWYWQAVYSGDANNNGATSDCTTEKLVINPNTPTISTALSESAAKIGDTVHDSATLTGATANAGGTVTYTVYTDSACSQGAQSAGTVTVSNGTVPDSNGITFNTAGTFYWQAVYSGDANNVGASSVCTTEKLVVSPNAPTIGTTLSAVSVSIGTPVHDSATLSGATSDAGGTVTYTVYTDSACSTGAQDAGTVTVTNGLVPDSNAISFSKAGTYYWQAVYSGDGNNLGATSTCTSEQLLVVKNSPSIGTTLSATSVSIGTAVHDSATLTGETGDAGGTVTYTVYTDSACTTGAQDAGTVTVTNGVVPDSNAITFNSAGTFYWQAKYSGDANNNAATSDCTSEQLVVNPNTPGMSTAQNLIPNDNATITGATGNAGGTITFNLFDPFDSTCSSAQPAYTETVTVNGNGTYTTTNTTFHAIDPGTWRWQVIYSGDANNVGTTSACGVEQFTIKNN